VSSTHTSGRELSEEINSGFNSKDELENIIGQKINLLLSSPKLKRHVVAKISPNPSLPKRGNPSLL
jgi:hypothetical protein